MRNKNETTAQVKAILKSDFKKSSIADGVITGVRLMEVNRTAHFKGPDGKAKSIECTPELISALMAHAGNRSIPSHLSHDHFGAETDAIHARLGSVKNIRLDESGNMIGDLHTMPNENGKLALWLAENDPDNAAMSAIFDYNAIQKDGKTYAHPLNFQTADLVAAGAACSALLAADNKTTMDIQELITLLDDPKAKDAIKAIVKSHQDTADTSEAAAMESDAGVTDADKKPEDSQKPALMAALRRVVRVVKRITTEASNSLGETKTAILAEAKTQAAAEATALLGRGGFPKLAADNNTGDEVETALAAYTATGCNRGTAILRLAKDKKDLYNRARKAGKL